ncbi:hypothetical protein [Mesorhizobium sophorae]|uniref:hypothetical protein n=1 Tax=Mesorhizobium sophorae TaxID=1300294 RepID=UPI00142D2EF2|nr:hypothetical protein [Mesorhizobium sophorae]
MLDLIPSPDDHELADIVRRTERLAMALVIGMAICLISAPAVYLTLAYYSH